MLFSSLEEAYFRVNDQGDPVDVKGRKITRVGRRLVVNYKNRYELALLNLDFAGSLSLTILSGFAYSMTRTMPYVLLGLIAALYVLVFVRVVVEKRGRIEVEPRNVIVDNISMWDYQLKRFALKIMFSDLGSIKNIIWSFILSAFFLVIGWVLFVDSNTFTMFFGTIFIIFGVAFFALATYMITVKLCSKIYYRNKPNLPEAFVWNWKEQADP